MDSEKMADKEEYLQILEKQSDKYTDPRVAKHFKGWNKTLQYHFTDIDEYYVIELVDGVPQPLEKKKLDDPTIKYSMSVDTFIELNSGKVSGFKLYQQKKLKVKATMPEMMKLQKLDKL